MAYKNPIICKEIYLPIPTKDMTFPEYQEEFGIDLSEFIDENGVFNCKGYKVYICDIYNAVSDNSEGSMMDHGIFPLLGTIKDIDNNDKVYLIAFFDIGDGYAYADGLTIDVANMKIGPCTDKTINRS